MRREGNDKEKDTHQNNRATITATTTKNKDTNNLKNKTKKKKKIIIYLVFNAHSSVKAKQNVFLPSVKILFHYLIHIRLSRTGDIIWGKMKLNEPGREKLGR